MTEFLTQYINVGNSIDSLWNIFMGLHLVLFASILKYGKVMSRTEKIGFIFAYIIFFVMNCRAIIHNYRLLDSIRKSFINTFNQDNLVKAENLFLLMSSGSLSYRIETTIFIHLFGLTVIVYLFYKRGKKHESSIKAQNN